MIYKMELSLCHNSFIIINKSLFLFAPRCLSVISFATSKCRLLVRALSLSDRRIVFHELGERKGYLPAPYKKSRFLRDLPISPGIRRPFEWDDETRRIRSLSVFLARGKRTDLAADTFVNSVTSNCSSAIISCVMNDSWTITAVGYVACFCKNHRRFSSLGVPFPRTTFTTRRVFGVNRRNFESNASSCVRARIEIFNVRVKITRA